MKYWQKILMMMTVVVISAWIILEQPSNSLRLAYAGLPLETSRALKQADRFLLFSLQPYPKLESGKFVYLPEKFHGYGVLGKTEITDKDERKRLLDQLFDCIPNRRPLSFAECFNPRHAIRVTHNGETVDLVICFECDGLKIFDSKESFLNLKSVNHSEFNRVLKAAGVKLAEY
jgi:hypothetical protein